MVVVVTHHEPPVIVSGRSHCLVPSKLRKEGGNNPECLEEAPNNRKYIHRVCRRPNLLKTAYSLVWGGYALVHCTDHAVPALYICLIKCVQAGDGEMAEYPWCYSGIWKQISNLWYVTSNYFARILRMICEFLSYFKQFLQQRSQKLNTRMWLFASSLSVWFI